jgi:hypothetical protein
MAAVAGELKSAANFYGFTPPVIIRVPCTLKS